MTDYTIRISVRKTREYNWKADDSRTYDMCLDAHCKNGESIDACEMKESVNLMLDKLIEMAEQIEDVEFKEVNEE